MYNEACRCALKKPSYIYCVTEWTSHVKIIGKYDVEDDRSNQNSILMSGMNVLYHVEHKDTFKKPSNIPILPSVIFTSKSGAACGIMGLEVDKEYLLSGTYKSGILLINSCSQMYGEGSLEYGTTPQDWTVVTDIQKSMLKNGNYNNGSSTE